jgi:hypothetical protein
VHETESEQSEQPGKLYTGAVVHGADNIFDIPGNTVGYRGNREVSAECTAGIGGWSFYVPEDVVEGQSELATEIVVKSQRYFRQFTLVARINCRGGVI